MDRKQFITFMLAILLSFQMVSALELVSYKITAMPRGSAVENIIELTLVNDKDEALMSGILNFAVDAEITDIRDSFGTLSFDRTKDEEKQKVEFFFAKPVEPQEQRVLTIETTTYNIVQKEGYFEYLLVLVPSKEIDAFTHILKLPSNAILQEEGTIIVPDATISETEQYTFIEWQTQLHADVPTVFLARFYQESVNWWNWFGIAVLFLGIGSFCGIAGHRFYVYHKKRKALKMTNILNVREKAVLEEVIKTPGIKQYEVVKNLGYTKSNMSKILKRLELRELIKIKKDGKVRMLNVGEKLEREL